LAEVLQRVFAIEVFLRARRLRRDGLGVLAGSCLCVAGRRGPAGAGDARTARG